MKFKKENIEQLGNRWFKSIQITCKQSSYSHYEYILKSKIIPHLGSVKVKKMNKDILVHFEENLLKELSNKTVKDILIVLKQILDYGNIAIFFLCQKY